jgi:hypothetical protein
MLFIFYFQENKEYLDVGIFVAVFVVLCILVILIVIKVGYLLFYRIKFCEKTESEYRRRPANTMAKRKSTKGQTTIYKTYIKHFLCFKVRCYIRNCYTVATMTWLTVMGYLCHKWPRICSTCRKHFPVLSSFMTYHRVCN